MSRSSSPAMAVLSTPHEAGAHGAPRRDRRRTARWLSLIVGVVGLLLLAAGCGSGASTTTAGVTATTGGDQQAARQAYRDCMAQNGVTLPQRGQGNGQGGLPGTDPGGVDSNGVPQGQGTQSSIDPAMMKKAQDACQSLRPTGGFGGGGTAFQAYVSCMKDHGVALPARGNGSTDTSAPPSTIDGTSAAYVAANDACKALLPAQGQGGSSTSTTAAP